MKTIFAAAMLAATAFTLPAFAQQPQIPCGKRADMTKNLTEKYGEVQAGLGLVNEQAVVEIWVSEGGQTWTILVTNSDGKSCITAAGENFSFEMPPAPEGESF